MHFKENDILYYVCPFTFIIEKVKINMGVKEKTGIYYIDQSGAYLFENNLFKYLAEAKQNALLKLDEFYYMKRMDIATNKPKIDKEF